MPLSVARPSPLKDGSSLPADVNRAIVDLAADMRDKVCGVDLAGPDVAYADRMGEFVKLLDDVWNGLREKAEAYVYTLQQWHLTAVLEPDETH